MKTKVIETTVDTTEYFDVRRLDFNSDLQFLAWRLQTVGIPAVAGTTRVLVQEGTLTEEKCPDRAATKYTWSST